METIIATIHAASHAQKPMGFCYDREAQGRERRQIIPDHDEPIRRNKRDELYVIGEDLARGEPRSFKLDQITEATTA